MNRTTIIILMRRLILVFPIQNEILTALSPIYMKPQTKNPDIFDLGLEKDTPIRINQGEQTSILKTWPVLQQNTTLFV